MEEDFKKLLKNYYVFVRDFFYELFESKIGYYASSLSWDTIFAIIPLMVVLLSVFTVLPIFDTLLEELKLFLFSVLIPANSQIILKQLESFLHNSDQLGIIGSFYVVFAVILFFKTYDYIINDIFETPKRGLWEAFKVYILFIILIPIGISSSIYISFYLEDKLNVHAVIAAILPFLITWVMFFAAYQISPNRPIAPWASMTSSFIASFVWYISKSLFVIYISRNQAYNTIYGSVSILLFFFLWIYLSWAIFLHGAKFCHLLNEGKEIDTIS
ncbi:MAG: YihY family inner membrane protein [Sulfurovaceae bacterium]|nr:YihY family inner membrane protein [Sulfurovaceae bacterium]